MFDDDGGGGNGGRTRKIKKHEKSKMQREEGCGDGVRKQKTKKMMRRQRMLNKSSSPNATDGERMPQSRLGDALTSSSDVRIVSSRAAAGNRKDEVDDIFERHAKDTGRIEPSASQELKPSPKESLMARDVLKLERKRFMSSKPETLLGTNSIRSVKQGKKRKESLDQEGYDREEFLKIQREILSFGTIVTMCVDHG